MKFDLAHLTEFAIAFFERLLSKYGKGRERRTELGSFETIKIRQVVANNAKLYVNRKDGFIGTGLKKDEFVSDCSDISDIIAFCKDGTFKVVRNSDKVFIGKNIIHTAVWKKGDERTTYNAIYVDGKTGKSFAKRFNVKAITRDKPYNVTKGAKGSRVHYFTANPNGESEIVNVQLSQGCKAKKKVFEFDFDELAIKGRGAGGNTLTKYPIRKVTQLEVGTSTLGSIKAWFDPANGRVNGSERGIFLGEFDTGDQLLALYKDGSYEVADFDINKRFKHEEIISVSKLYEQTVVSAVYFDGAKGWTLVKRFEIETTTNNQRFSYLTEHKSSKLFFASVKDNPVIKYNVRINKIKEEFELEVADFIDVKGWKSLGNKLEESRITNVKEEEQLAEGDSLKAGDTIEFEVNGQGTMFEEED